MTKAKKDISWMAAILVPAIVFMAFAMVQPAESHNLDWDWDPVRSGQWVGTCGGNAKNLVYAVQGMMVVGHWYADAGYTNSLEAQFDGVIGTKTKNAIKQYQGDHGLTVDGCIGPNGWDSLRYDHGHMTGSYPNYDWNGGWGAEWVDFYRASGGSPGEWRIEGANDNGHPYCYADMNSNNTLCDHSGGSCAGSISNWVECN